MAKIREDLIGAVHVDGHVLFAGDTVPKGAKVGKHLTDVIQDLEDWRDEYVSESAPESAEPPKPKRGRPRKKPVEVADDAEVD